MTTDFHLFDPCVLCQLGRCDECLGRTPVGYCPCTCPWLESLMARKLRRMTDSTTAADNPASDEMVAGYVDGSYANVDELRHRYGPGVKIVTISAVGEKPADVIDREKGDVSAHEAAVIIKHDGAHTGYCDLARLHEFLVAIADVGLPPSTPIWTAHYTGTEHLCDHTCLAPYALPYVPHVVATQWDDKGPAGQHYDRSLVAAYWPGVDPQRPHPPATPLAGVTRPALKAAIAHLSNRHVPVADQADAKLLEAAQHQIARVLAIK